MTNESNPAEDGIDDLVTESYGAAIDRSDINPFKDTSLLTTVANYLRYLHDINAIKAQD